MAKPGRPPLVPGWANLVFDVLPDPDQDVWLTGAQIAALTGLTIDQVSKAIAYLRDNFPAFPLISSQLGYRFSVDESEIAAFRSWRARTAYTILRRLWSGVVRPYVASLGDARNERQTTKQFDRLLQDIEDLVA